MGRQALQAVLFDMDGLLIDSEPLWLESEREVVGRLGGQWSAEHQKMLVGGPIARAVDYMLEMTGSKVAPEEVLQWLLDGMVGRLRGGVELLPGADRLLDTLAADGVPCALVSSSYRPLVDAALDSVGAGRFAVTVAGDEVAGRKPAPDPYVLAARMLGVAPERCVALEDSHNGVASAEAAGCVTVAVPSVVPVEPAPTRTVVGSLRELDPRQLNALVEERRFPDSAALG